MATKLKFSFAILIAALGLSSPSYTRASDDLRSKLELRIQDYTLHSDNFLSAITHIADEFRIPLGVIWVAKPPAQEAVNLFWKNAKVQDVLQDLVRTQRGYELEIGQDIVHVRFKDIPPSQDFLQLRIKEFSVHHEVVQSASLRLRELIKSTVAPKREKPGGIGRSSITNVGEPTFDLTVNNVTVEQILDSIAKVSARKIWVVTYADSFIPASSGFRRTLTLWSGSPVSDDDQPVWNFFTWDERIPMEGSGSKPMASAIITPSVSFSAPLKR